MASHRHASDEETYGSFSPYGTLDPHTQYDAPYDAGPGDVPAYFGPERIDDQPLAEWNPGTDTLRPVRGRHRVTRQRGGTIARSRAVLGVGVIAAVGAGGMATANEQGAPGVGAAADKIRSIPDRLPGLFGEDQDAAPQQEPEAASDVTAQVAAAPLNSDGMVALNASAPSGSDPTEALRSRLRLQAETREAEALETARAEAVEVAAAAAAAEAEERRLAEEEEQRRLEEERRLKEEEERRRQEEERLQQLRASYSAPLGSYRITATFGQAGSMWSSGYHDGVDMAAAAGTPVKNIHTGVVTEAGWSGSFGYRVAIQLDDGTEVSYNHLSSIAVSVGQEVVTGEIVGNVGSTGNSSGPHLHVQVEIGGSAVDPLAWMRNNGVSI